MKTYAILLTGALMILAALAHAATGAPAPAQKRPPDAGAPRDLAPPPQRLTRALSDAYNYNRLQRTLLEHERDRILAELSRLELERQEIATRIKTECQADVSVDTWDERSLEIHRRTP